MPPWVEELLKQSPLLASALIVAWFAFRYIAKMYEEQTKATAAEHKQHVADLSASFKQHLASKRAEIARLRKDKEQVQMEKEALRQELRDAREDK